MHSLLHSFIRAPCPYANTWIIWNWNRLIFVGLARSALENVILLCAIDWLRPHPKDFRTINVTSEAEFQVKKKTCKLVHWWIVRSKHSTIAYWPKYVESSLMSSSYGRLYDRYPNIRHCSHESKRNIATSVPILKRWHIGKLPSIQKHYVHNLQSCP